MIIDRKDDIMNNSIYYKAADEDGNTVLKHSWKKHKYLYIKNGRYVYPEDVKKSSVPYKGPTSAMQAQKAQNEKDLQKRARAINAHTVAKKNADMVRKKQEQQMKQIAANVKKQNDPSTKVKKTAKFVKKVVTRDAAAKKAVAKYYIDKADKSPTVNAARAKANSVKSKAEYKLTRAGEKLTNDVKRSGAYKSAKKGINSISKNANKAYKSAKKGINSISRDANKAYKSAKKKAKKVNRTFNKVKRAGKAYIDYLTK